MPLVDVPGTTTPVLKQQYAHVCWLGDRTMVSQPTTAASVQNGRKQRRAQSGQFEFHRIDKGSKFLLY